MYLKHIVSEFAHESSEKSRMLRTHNISMLINFLLEDVKDFTCDYEIVRGANGYYYNTRYPGDDFIKTNDYDYGRCKAAYIEVRKSVLAFCHTSSPNLSDKSPIDGLKGMFDNL